MDVGELADHLNRQTNRWPDTQWGDREALLATLAQYRLLKTIGENRVIWANGTHEETENGDVVVQALLFTEAYVVTDESGGPKAQGVTPVGTTQVIPWTELTRVTLHQYWPDGPGSQTETARFTLHMGDGRDFEIKSGTTEGTPATLELLDFALRKLETKK